MSAESDCRWLSASPDYYPELKRFRCAMPVSDKAYRAVYERYVEADDEVGFANLFTVDDGSIYYKYEMEVQEFVRHVRYDLDFQYQWADLCVADTHDARKLGAIYGFVFAAVEMASEPNGMHMGYIGYIARSVGARNCRIGSALLNHACARIHDQCAGTGNGVAIVARIHPENAASMKLFTRHGFEDHGVDPDATAYHRWVRFDD